MKVIAALLTFIAALAMLIFVVPPARDFANQFLPEGMKIGEGHQVTFQPVMIPVVFTINDAGDVKVGVDNLHITTPVGTFTLDRPIKFTPTNDTYIVIIRDRRKSSPDTVYRIRSDAEKFTAETDGRTKLEYGQRQLLIDVTEAEVRKIQIGELRPAP